jgi:hypothetical protein
MEVLVSKKKAAWTVMVYLAGDNNLSPECLFALTEMKKANPGEEINVIAQFDPRDEHLPTHRYEINRTGPTSTLFEDIIDRARFDSETAEIRFFKESRKAAQLAKSRLRQRRSIDTIVRNADDLNAALFEQEPVTDDTDTGSPFTLYNFLSFCIQEYPAEHYLVVLSGHAGGTESDYLLKDESSRGSLTFNELKQVFVQLQNDLDGRAIDIIGMDNCLMSMGEICYEFRGLAQIVVGCESYSPASGWPYRQIIERLKEFTGKASKRREVQTEAASALVEAYVNYYAPYWMAGVSVTQSALDVRRVVDLRKHVDRLAATMERELKKECRRRDGNRRGTFKDALVLAHWEAQSYNGEWFVDLFDFCDCLQKRTNLAAVGRACEELKKFLASKFVLKSCYCGAAYQYSYGVSLYFPWSQVAGKYRNLDFVNDSSRGWLQFLETYTQLTRRGPRAVESIQANSGQRKHQVAASESADARMSEVRMSEVRMSEVRMSEVRMSEVRMSEVRMMAAEGKNPIHSMRNPPIVFFPTQCIAQDKEVMEGLRKFFG